MMNNWVVCGWCQESGNPPGPALPDGWVMFDEILAARFCCPECAKNNLPEDSDE